MIGYLTTLPWLLPGSALGLVVAVPASRTVAGWLGARRWIAWLLLVALGVIAAATLTPLGRDAVEGSATGTCDLSRVRPATQADIDRSPDVGPNILLFVPLGFAVAMVPWSRRKAALVTGSVALPLAIESVQLLATPLHRGCESADVVDNLTGLVVGYVAGFVLLRLARAAIRGDPGVSM